VLVSVVLTTAAATFDQPARQALIPAMVPRAQLPQAFALLNPSRELAFLLGPALAGVLITMGGPGLAYAVDAATYALLVCVLAVLRIPGAVSQHAAPSVWAGIGEGLSFVRHRPLICLLMGLDLSATLFGAYRVVLPALALRVLHVCSTGYGLLSAAPSAGALLATYGVFRIVGRSRRLGRVLLVSTLLYGVSAVLLAQAPWFWVALTAALLLGAFDALPTSIRLAAIQLETPDRLRGRVSAFYQMPARGGPALGDVVIGAIAGAIGPVAALTVGGLVTVGYVSGFLARPNRVRDYTGSRSAGDAESRDQELRAAPA
jgi:MFS family permease